MGDGDARTVQPQGHARRGRQHHPGVLQAQDGMHRAAGQLVCCKMRGVPSHAYPHRHRSTNVSQAAQLVIVEDKKWGDAERDLLYKVPHAQCSANFWPVTFSPSAGKAERWSAGHREVWHRRVERHQRGAAAKVGRPGHPRQGVAVDGLAVPGALCGLEGQQVRSHRLAHSSRRCATCCPACAHLQLRCFMCVCVQNPEPAAA